MQLSVPKAVWASSYGLGKRGFDAGIEFAGQRPIDGRAAARHITRWRTPRMTAPRLPTDLHPPRMDALARLPVFLALEGRRAVVAGGDVEAGLEGGMLSAGRARVRGFAGTAGGGGGGGGPKPPRGALRGAPPR